MSSQNRWTIVNSRECLRLRVFVLSKSGQIGQKIGKGREVSLAPTGQPPHFLLKTATEKPKAPIHRLNRGLSIDYICLCRYTRFMNLKDSAAVFNALADQTRLRILNLLSEGELCVCDLMRVLKEPQSKVSRHLAYLRQTGLVQRRKEGLWMHYRLSRPTTKIYSMLLKTISCCRSEFDDFKKDMKALNQNKDCLVGCCK